MSEALIAELRKRIEDLETLIHAPIQSNGDLLSRITTLEGGEGFETIVIASEAPYLVIQNTTHEDTDGGRESYISFRGEQSGGEESTLARIYVYHVGSGDDETGGMVIGVNAGSDGDTPTAYLTLKNGCIGLKDSNPDSSYAAEAGDDINVNGDIYINDVKVLDDQQSHITDAGTSHSITDPGDSPADADALRDDLVANTIPDIESALDLLGTVINNILTMVEAHGLMASS